MQDVEIELDANGLGHVRVDGREIECTLVPKSLRVRLKGADVRIVEPVG